MNKQAQMVPFTQTLVATSVNELEQTVPSIRKVFRLRLNEYEISYLLVALNLEIKSSRTTSQLIKRAQRMGLSIPDNSVETWKITQKLRRKLRRALSK